MQEVFPSRLDKDELFLREVGFRFGKLRPIGTRITHLGEFGVERLRSTRVAGCLCRASGTQKTVEAVGRILQDRLVFGDGFGWTLEFQEHVREHFAGGNADGFAAIFVLTAGGGAQFLDSFVRFSQIGRAHV